jgi:hypothetical protein
MQGLISASAIITATTVIIAATAVVVVIVKLAKPRMGQIET